MPNMRRKYGTELLETNYSISFHMGPDTWTVPFCWQPDGRGNYYYYTRLTASFPGQHG